MYFWIVRLHTQIPSLSNSPRMRSAPQSRLLLAISLINAIVSGEIFDCLASAFDLCFQNKRKSSRCHRSKVSGCTMKSACFQVRIILARNNKRNLSVFLQVGRLTCRRRMMSCCRNNAWTFSLRRIATQLSRWHQNQHKLQEIHMRKVHFLSVLTVIKRI